MRGSLARRFKARDPKLVRVWCLVCGHSRVVSHLLSTKYGWPMCCGHTMTVDPPDEWEVRR